ncbi:MAG: prepilin-type N-terminal cleavage/methylation domain-containing protein [Deltaproteobacteria bacterium]|nr:prepilin-type N-terminal cleavage/methylation domain-containing protein [Deltaproteobacteria bacterium]
MIRKRTRQRGNSLVELMVATVLLTMLLGVIYSAFASQGHTYAAQTQLTETMTGVRAALQVMTDQIALAGYGVPSANSPSTATKLVTATSSTLTFVANINCVQSFLSAGASKNAGSIQLVSSAGFEVQDAIYVSDGSNWYSGAVSSMNGNTLNVTPALTFAFAAGTPVNPVNSVTFRFEDGRLKRNDQSVAGNVTGITFTYDSAQLSAIRRIGVTLSAQTRSLVGSNGQPLAVSLSTEVAPKNLGL